MNMNATAQARFQGPTIRKQEHHPSCKDSDKDLVYHCSQCGINEPVEINKIPEVVEMVKEWKKTLRDLDKCFNTWQPSNKQPQPRDFGPLKMIQVYDMQYKFVFNLTLENEFVPMRPEWMWRRITPPDVPASP